MSDMLPLATYNLNVEPYEPTPAIGLDLPVTIRITMAAIDPESLDDEKKPSTLRMIKRNPEFGEHDEGEDEEEDEDDDEHHHHHHHHDDHDHDHHHHHHHDHDDEEEEEQEKSHKKGKKKAHSKKDEESSSDEDLDDESDEESDDDEFEECILLTLSPETQFQQALDITIAPEEDVQFVVTGSYSVSLTGNYVKHPFDTPVEDEGEEASDEEEYDSEEELTPEDCLLYTSRCV